MNNWHRALVAGRGGKSKYKILAQAIAADIESGALKDGAQLPPQRDVGQELGVSVQTVTNAYKELERHGLIRCEVGRGSFVSKRTTEGMSVYMLDKSELELVDFSMARLIHTPEHDQAWRQLCAELASEERQPWMRDCRPIAGFEYHRAVAATWLETLGIRTTLDTLLITNGASHGIFVALASLVNPGDVVLSANLTDHTFIGGSHVLGFTLKGLDSDEHGIRPEHFEEMCASERITALVCTPNLNNPTVALMPDSRRRAIARIAERYGVYIIEDDVYGPLLAQRPPPVSSYLPELAFYCTSFTKSVLTGLRTGYMTVPRRLALRVDSIMRVSSWMATPLLAEAATRWIADGTAARLIQLQRERLAARHAMLRGSLGEYVIGQHPNGLSAWIGIPAHWRLDSLVGELRNRKIAVTPPDPFLVRGTPRPNAIRLCLGAEADDEQVQAALAMIRELYDQYPKIHDFM
jgi:DNA-binding transcriptional MocR family regulator